MVTWDQFYKAARLAVQGDVAAAKRAAAPVGLENYYEVVYVGEWAFSRIVGEFIRQRHPDLGALVGTQELWDEFREFHKTHAKLALQLVA